MPETPKAQQIERAAVTALEGVSVAAGYQFDYKAVRLGAVGFDAVSTYPTLAVWPTEEPGEIQVEGQRRLLLLPVWGYYRNADEAELWSDLNKIRQDVERALIKPAPSQPLGLDFVQILEIHEVRKSPSQSDDVGGVLITFAVTYYYEHGNP